MKGLTERQEKLFSFIQEHFSENGYWPSIREIQKHFGFKSTNAVMGHLRALENKGAISRVAGQARAYHICPKAVPFKSQETHNTISIPIYGSIAAGYPDRVESGDAIGSIQIDVSTAGIRSRDKTFALKVSGDSMIDAGIHTGDIVIVEPGEPKNRDIVAALIDGETTLKRYIYDRPNEPYLKAENKNYPNLFPVNELMIQGIARSVVRCL